MQIGEKKALRMRTLLTSKSSKTYVRCSLSKIHEKEIKSHDKQTRNLNHQNPYMFNGKRGNFNFIHFISSTCELSAERCMVILNADL